MLGLLLTAHAAAPTVGMVGAPHQGAVQLTETVLPARTIASFTALETGAPVYHTPNGAFGVGVTATGELLATAVPSEDRSFFGAQSGSVGGWALLQSSRIRHGIGLIGHLGARQEGLYALTAHTRTSGVSFAYRIDAQLTDGLSVGGDVDAGWNGTTLIHAAISPWITGELGKVSLHARGLAGLQNLGAMSVGASVDLGRVNLAGMVHTAFPLLGELPVHVLPQLTARYTFGKRRELQLTAAPAPVGLRPSGR